MSGTLFHQSEILRLARVLGVTPEELDFLKDAPVTALAELRATVLDRLLEESRGEFERAVALADKIPRGLAATLAQRAMGPVLGGRAAALLTADMAADLAARLPAEFLADVSCHVDLRHVGPLIGGIPTDAMAAAGRVLREREEWIILAACVGDVPEAKLEILLDEFDAEALLRAGFVLEDVSRLDAVIALLPRRRLDELFAGAHEHDLWPEAMAVAIHIGPEQGGRIVAAIDDRPDAEIDALLNAAHDHGLWPEAITIAGHIDDHARVGGIGRAIERLPAVRLDELLYAAHGASLWPHVIRIATPVVRDGLEGSAVLAAIERLPGTHLDALLAAADTDGLWAQLVIVASRLDPEAGDAVLAAVDRLDAGQQSRLAEAINASAEINAAAAPLIALARPALRRLIDA